MKIALLVILLAALGLGLWQGQELSRLKDREAALGTKPGSTLPTSLATHEPSIPTKSALRDAKAPLDAVALVQKIEGWVAMEQNGSHPSEEDGNSLREAIISASPRELKMLAEELRRSGLPEELKKEMYLPIAPRLAENDPKLALELMVGGGAANSFHMIMRSWLLRDPRSAAAWMEEATAGDPPLKSRLPLLEALDLQALSYASRLAADPAGESLDDLLARKGTALETTLREIAVTLPPAELATVLNRISKDPDLPDAGDLDPIGYTLARHEDPALARQILLDAALPPEQFTKAATTLILNSDPIGIRAGLEWYRNSAPDETKAAGLRGMVSAWAGKDRKSAIGWVEGLPDSAEKSELLGIASGDSK